MSAAVNAARGEVSVEVDGAPRMLCLTLGALAEIETALGCRTLGELEARLKQLSATDLLSVLAILLKAGGEVELAAGLAARRVNLKAAAGAVGEAFSRALS